MGERQLFPSAPDCVATDVDADVLHQSGAAAQWRLWHCHLSAAASIFIGILSINPWKPVRDHE